MAMKSKQPAEVRWEEMFPEELLAAIDTCADARALTERVQPPDDDESRNQIDAIRKLVAEATVLRAAGKYGPGLELSTAAVEQAQQLGRAREKPGGEGERA